MDDPQPERSIPRYIASNYAASTENTERAQSTYDENDSIQRVEDLSAAVPTADSVANASEFNQHSRDTSSSIISSTAAASADLEENGAFEEDELEELLSSVKEAAQSELLRLKHDGFHSRYSVRLPNPAEESTQRLEPREESSLLPRPLMVRSNTQASDDPDREILDLQEFLKWLEDDLKRRDALKSAVARASSAAHAEEYQKALASSPFAALKRFLSKESKTAAKSDAEGKGMSPLLSRIMSRKTSFIKLNDRDGATEPSPSLQAVTPSPSGSTHPANFTPLVGESEFKTVPYDLAYALSSDNESTPAPPPKSNRRRPLLSVNTENANGSPSWDPKTATGGTPRALANARHDTDYFSSQEDKDKRSQPTTPTSRGRSKTFTSVTDKGKAKRSSSLDHISSIFSPASGKKKFEKFTNESPEVKLIELFHLNENFGIQSTKEFLTKDDEKPSPRKALMSRAIAAPADPAQAPNASQLASTGVAASLSPAPVVPVVTPKKLGTTPPLTLHNSLLSPMAKEPMRGSSDNAKFPFSSRQISTSATTSTSPISPHTGGSMRIRRKKVGSGNAKGDDIFASLAYECPNGSGSFGAPISVALSSKQPSAAIPACLSSNGSGNIHDTAVSTHQGIGEVLSVVAGTPQVIAKAYAPANIEPSFNDAFESSGDVDSPGNDSIGTAHTSRVSSVSEAAGSREYGSQEGSSSAAASRTSNPGSFSGVTRHAIHGIDLEVGDVGKPSVRHKLEEAAAEKAADQKMAKEEHVKYKINQLRKATGTELVWDSSTDPHTSHPNHGCAFFQKNLMCQNCHPNCAICDFPCCAFKAAMQKAKEHPGLPEGEKAKELGRAITQWMSEGRDANTFLTCTECNLSVCPHCIGICPVLPCLDRVCAQCNPGRLWKPCGYHTIDDLEISEEIRKQYDRT